jgi:hypothetical protein
MAHDPSMPLPVAALAMASGMAIGLWVLGRRFARDYLRRYGAIPPNTWMFKRERDPDLERTRRFALVALPILVASLLIYLARP